MRSFPNRGYYVYSAGSPSTPRCIEFCTGLEALEDSLATNRANSNALVLLRANLERAKAKRHVNHPNMLKIGVKFHRPPALKTIG